MTAQQRIVRVRRSYNQWVANQTLEDYALRFTAKSARRWSSFSVANTAIGAVSFLALEAIGGSITVNYGFLNATSAILVVGALIFLTCIPIAYYAATYGIDIDLLTRGAGFGYIGSTITSLIYASFTFLFFAIEAAIMSLALEMCFGVPLFAGYVLSSLIVIPLVTHGITFISRLQLWTQPVWIVLHLLPFAFIAFADTGSFERWTGFSGTAGADGQSFNLILFGTAATVVFSLIAQIGEQVDFLRFLPPRDKRGASWWAAYLCAGPGWIIPGVLKMLAGSFLAFLAIEHLVPPEKAAEPTQMYLVGFQYVFSSPQLALAFTGAFVIISQIKINVTNAYAGSLAWSNFFSRLTHSHPGRVVWLVFNVAIALMLMELGIFKMLEHILGLYSIVAVAWVGALVADLAINKPLGLSPAGIEFKRAHLYDINPVGVGAMLCRDHRRDHRIRRRARNHAAIAVGVPRARGGLRHGAGDRLCDQEPFLHRARAAAELERPNGRAMRNLRAPVRDRGHGALSRLFRADLLALLHARNPLPGLLQAAGPHLDADAHLARADPADLGHPAAQHRRRALSRRAAAVRRRDRLGAVSGLFSGLARFRRAQGTAQIVPLDRVLHSHHHRRRGRLAVRSGAGQPPRRRGGDATGRPTS